MKHILEFLKEIKPINREELRNDIKHIIVWMIMIIYIIQINLIR